MLKFDFEYCIMNLNDSEMFNVFFICFHCLIHSSVFQRKTGC